MKISTLNLGHQNYKKFIDEKGKTKFITPTKIDKEKILSKAVEDTISSIKEIIHHNPQIDVLSLTEIYFSVLYNSHFIANLESMGLTYFVPNCNHCHSQYKKNSNYMQLSTCIIMKKEFAKNFQVIDAEIMPNLFLGNRKGGLYDSCTARECRILNDNFEIVSLYIPAGIGNRKYQSVKSHEKLLSEMKINFKKNGNKKYIYLGDFNLIIPHFNDKKSLSEYKTNYPIPYFYFKDFLEEYDRLRTTNETWKEESSDTTHGLEKIDYIFSSQFKSTKSSVYIIDPKTFSNKYHQEIQIIDHKPLSTDIEY